MSSRPDDSDLTDLRPELPAVSSAPIEATLPVCPKCGVKFPIYAEGECEDCGYCDTTPFLPEVRVEDPAEDRVTGASSECPSCGHPCYDGRLCSKCYYGPHGVLDVLRRRVADRERDEIVVEPCQWCEARLSELGECTLGCGYIRVPESFDEDEPIAT